MTRTALVALLALCVATWAPALAAKGKGARESMEEADDAPRNFPEGKAVPFSPDKLPTPTPKTSLEAIDMKNSAGLNDTERVNHTQVKDPGTTHAEGTEGSTEGAGRGSIRACTLPNSLREHGANGTSSASDWLADSGNFTKVCHVPVRWLHGASASGTVRVCTIPHDAWNSSYTVTDGTIPKELLAELNTSSVKCVTPSEALSNSSGGVTGDSIANGSIPSAWLRESNDTIYIYIIPQEWLRGSQPPASLDSSEVEDLTKDTLDTGLPTADPNAVANTTDAATAAPGTRSAADAASTTVASAGDAAAAAGTATNQTLAPSANSTTPAVGNSTSAVAANATVVAPIAKVTESNGTLTSTSTPATSTNTTKSLKEETAKPTEKPREETTKPSAQPKEDTTKPTTKPAEGTTKGTDKPAALPVTTVTKKPVETVTGGTETKTTERPKETEKPEEHSDTENEVSHRPSSEALSQHSDHNHAASSGKTAFLQPTESAAILAGVFVAIALLGYAGLLLWRRVLEKRYGNREMLVNEDDDFDTSDMRHFEL